MTLLLAAVMALAASTGGVVLVGILRTDLNAVRVVLVMSFFVMVFLIAFFLLRVVRAKAPVSGHAGWETVFVMVLLSAISMLTALMSLGWNADDLGPRMMTIKLVYIFVGRWPLTVFFILVAAMFGLMAWRAIPRKAAAPTGR